MTEKIQPEKRAAFCAVFTHPKPQDQKANFNQYRKPPRPTPYDEKRCKTLRTLKKNKPNLGGPNLSCKVAHKKQTNPPMNPGSDETAGVHWEGADSRGENQTTSIVIIPRSCAGSQTPRSPHRACTQLVSPSTPSRSRVRRHERSTGAVGAGGFAGASARLPYPSPKEQKQDARVLNKKENAKNATPTRPRTKGKTQGKHGKGNPTHPEEKKKKRH